MPRKRTVSDDAVLDAALLLVRERGPDALSFGALSARVALSGSTLVQRFKTKPDLLRAALLRAWEQLEERTVSADTDAPDGPDGVVEFLVGLTGQYDPAGFADQLLLLREDLRDPVLRARGDAWLASVVAAVERRLGGATGGAAGLGRVIVTQWQGSLTVWGFTREAAIDAYVEASVRDLLRRLVPELVVRRRARRPAR